VALRIGVRPFGEEKIRPLGILVVQSVSYSLPRILADVPRHLRHLREWLMRF
jgi:hypothetical protein